ncbi:hypothetical protein [Dysgonomonas sp. Marseille-P4361]|uniref:hypothetical protein n=1 Tax=Dysgonomonas sp. Marseille-P4361 TaxID=2161820 RepID=UPI0021016CFA|nr:hypothetical protein [Dysgonomonas sp. Marseille-P4361]
MKRLLFLFSICILLSSCATIFTNSRQSITFSGPEGTKIYDADSNVKLAEIGSDGTATARIKKKATRLSHFFLNQALMQLRCGIFCFGQASLSI